MAKRQQVSLDNGAVLAGVCCEIGEGWTSSLSLTMKDSGMLHLVHADLSCTGSQITQH